MIKSKFDCPQDKAQEVLASVKEHYAENAGDAKIDTVDGIRIDLPQGWVQLRASNTEPIMRIMAEANSIEDAQELVDQVQALIKL